MGRKRRFTPEQETEIARLYTEDGLSIDVIGERVGVQDATHHYTSVRASLLRSGVTLRPRATAQPESEWTFCECGNRAMYKTSRKCSVCYNRIRNASPEIKEHRANWALLKQYGLTRADYDAMLASQGGVCAICQGLDPREARLAVDHDHSCCQGEKSCEKCRRGLLCVNCNRAVGLLKDSAENAARLATYLAR